MKRNILTVIFLTISAYCFAQEQLSFPFQGGKEAMTQFFRDSLNVSQDITQKKAIGTAVIKFTANQNGGVSKIVVYYADDAILVQPVIDALRKTNHKWIISANEKAHDFIIPFVFTFNPPDAAGSDLQKKVYDNYRRRNPIMAKDQVPLDETTLLPPVPVNYDLP
ncbi:hypothetical protein [Mucilaginibacter gotjawali]|uniref:Uncharacterized protein n=2 Tax=Mucilaginibacter gotjawali TaxID=1550579 RepID=A0A839SKI8_9SPHI|nr:hypothetical protein [Mucilaginibacter gotjawali]MBB3058851.1 hypothetical protein [Mucilaginibacter gotjawali]BAU52180.1 hypothetical protein MgSA37_00330 [Mucilaginibacter gotjawali]